MFLAVFQRIVYENAHQLLDLVGVAVIADAVLDVQLQLLFLLERLSLKGQRCAGKPPR